MRPKYEIGIVLPTLNEAENVRELCVRLVSNLNKAKVESFEIIFVDDNSKDETIERIVEAASVDQRIKYISMSRRFGDQESIIAGMDYSDSKAVIIMDSDLQHPPEEIPRMIRAWKNGADVVIMQRVLEGHTKTFQKLSEIWFYGLLMRISASKIYFRFAGFTLLDRKVVDSLSLFEESEPFLRGMIPFVGFNQMVLEYTEAFRSCGLSKYRFSDRLNLAVRGIVGFSTRPLTLVIWIGLSILALVGGYLIYLIVSILFFGMSFLPGWTSIVALIGILTGIQITTLGIVGLYVGKIFLEVKKRPRYLVKEVYDNDK